ncbi:hypothetical protein [Symbioplanes lichenis]|uniref:hypothetical protein n=1 Tax=Symbioplanes lichenis TaxID=1629072 RepID=UPI00273A50CD|nr:hypothetical protein [Actinoplanes lichenis]
MNLDDLLRAHDPAHPIPDDLASSPRAAATLARVTSMSARPARPRRRAVRFALAGVVAAAAVVVSAPILGTDRAALATWDASPRSLSAQETAAWVRDCAGWTHTPAGDYQVVEARGTWVMTYLESATSETQCLKSTVKSSEYPDGEGEAMSGPALPAPAADALTTVGVHETSGGIASATMFMVGGRAGADVAGVVFHSQGMNVRATVKDGRFTAWWPRMKPATVAGRLIEDTGYNGSPNPDVTITLRGGRTVTKPVKAYDSNH